MKGKKRTHKGSVFAMFQKLSVNVHTFQNTYEENEKVHILLSNLYQNIKMEVCTTWNRKKESEFQLKLMKQ